MSIAQLIGPVMLLVAIVVAVLAWRFHDPRASASRPSGTGDGTHVSGDSDGDGDGGGDGGGGD